jgi:hypothetical protein
MAFVIIKLIKVCIRAVRDAKVVFVTWYIVKYKL